ncbi:MAG: hypothetical protein ACRDT4_26430 [Micromonosporaceae bacterium]
MGTAVGRARVIIRAASRLRRAPYTRGLADLTYQPGHAPMRPPANLPADRHGVWRRAAEQHYQHQPEPGGVRCRAEHCRVISPDAGYPCPGVLSADQILGALAWLL